MSCALIGTTFAAVENIKVSGDINAEALTRDLSMGSRVTLGVNSTDDDTVNFLFSQVRLRFDADLTEGVSAVVRLLNERIWGNETDTGGDTEVQLDLGYVELKEFLYQPLTLVIGRQNLRYGSGLVVGDPDTNRVVSTKVSSELGDLSLRKSFDAVRAIFDYAPYTLDLVYSKISEGTLDTRDDISVAGVNIAYDWDSYNGVTEVYGFWAEGRSATQIAEDHEDRTITIGGRAQFDPNDNLTLGLEGAVQVGDSWDAANSISRDREAIAIQAMAEYKFLDEKNSKVGVAYSYLSGDDNATDSEDNAWDVVFEDQTPAEILNIVQGNTNLQYVSVSASLMPQDDITVGLLYTHARLAEDLVGPATLETAAVAGSPIATETYYVRASEDHLGDEIDVWGVYDYTEDVQVKLNGAFFIPGDLFRGSNDATSYSVRGGVNVNF